jgi:hypothetical protein
MGEAVVLAGIDGFRVQSTADSGDSPAGAQDEQDTAAGAKAFATLQAQLALRGFSLTELAGGGYLVSRWDRTGHLNDLRSVREFLRRVGGHHG